MSLKTNVTKVKFNRLQFVQVKEITQYDKGQVIEFLDDYIEDGIEVQFGNTESEETIDRIVKNKKVTIPDELIESPHMICAWVKIVTEDSETTVKGISIPIKHRPKPSGLTAPEDEPTLREEFLRILNETKAIAQSVRDDANAGKFNGEKGDRGEKGETGDAYEPIYTDTETGEKYKLIVSAGEIYMEKVEV